MNHVDPIVPSACRAFGLRPSAVTAMPRSTLCAVLRVRTDSGTWGLKIFPAIQPAQDLEDELHYVRALRQEGCAVPLFERTRGGAPYFTAADGRRVAVYRWVDGRHRDVLDDDALLRLLRGVAGLHLSSAGLDRPRAHAWMWEEQRRYAASMPIPPAIAEAVAHTVARGRPWDDDEPGSPCHNDLNLGNVLWARGGEPHFIDFTNAVRAPLEWDLAVLFAELMLGRAHRDPLGCATATVASYLAGPLTFTPHRFWSLLPTALVQRTIFKAFPAPPDARASAWARLRQALDEFAHVHGIHPAL